MTTRSPGIDEVYGEYTERVVCVYMVRRRSVPLIDYALITLPPPPPPPPRTVIVPFTPCRHADTELIQLTGCGNSTTTRARARYAYIEGWGLRPRRP